MTRTAGTAFVRSIPFVSGLMCGASDSYYMHACGAFAQQVFGDEAPPLDEEEPEGEGEGGQLIG
jgi:hypothetical protein